MEEKIIVKSDQYNVKRVCLTIFIILAVVLNIALNSLFLVSKDIDRYIEVKEKYGGSNSVSATDSLANARDMLVTSLVYLEGFSLGLAAVVSVIVYFGLGKTQLVVSNKRVYGSSAFGKRVDLPIDSISAIGSKWPKGVVVASSSGKISFPMIKNRDEIHKSVSKLLIERQTKEQPITTITQELPKSEAEELKKYKELLDMGVLSPEEFDAKKKQLLGL